MSQSRIAKVLKGLSVIVVATCLLAGCGSTAEPEPDSVTLRLTDFFPSQHFVAVNGVAPFMERVEELSDGEIQWEYYPGGQLVDGGDAVTGAQTGLTDIAYFTMPYSSQDLPLLSVCSLPNAFETAAVGIEACGEVIDTQPVQDSFADLGVHYMWGFMMPPYTIQTSDRELKSMQDLRGLKIQSSGGVYSDTLQAAGAVAVEMPAGELYEGLDRGTVDGSNLNLFSLHGYGIAPLLEHSVTGINAGSLLSGFVINDEAWNRLTPRHQKILEKASAEQQKSLTSWLDDNLPGEAESLEGEGMGFNEFDEPDAWNEAVQPVWEQWVPQMDKRGLDGRTVMNAWNRGLEKSGAGVDRRP